MKCVKTSTVIHTVLRCAVIAEGATTFAVM